VYQDTKQLIAESQFARRLGYIGKFAIHPNQIDPINSCFSPTQQELDQARRIIEAYNNAEVVGRGSTSLDGLMIDTPVVERALQVLEYEKKLNFD
jgi:citrate lyase beta subunit